MLSSWHSGNIPYWSFLEENWVWVGTPTCWCPTHIRTYVQHAVYGTCASACCTAHLCHVHNCVQAGEEGGIEKRLSGVLQHSLHGLGREEEVEKERCIITVHTACNVLLLRIRTLLSLPGFNSSISRHCSRLCMAGSINQGYNGKCISVCTVPIIPAPLQVPGMLQAGALPVALVSH